MPVLDERQADLRNLHCGVSPVPTLPQELQEAERVGHERCIERSLDPACVSETYKEKQNRHDRRELRQEAYLPIARAQQR